MKFSRLLLLVASLPLLAHGQNKPGKNVPTKLPEKKSPPSRVGLEAAKSLRLNYGYPSWNKDPAKIDSASILLREGSSGRIVQIQLEETAPDSGIFSGLFSVQWESLTKLAPEFFVPPQELLTSTKGLRKLNEMIQSNELKRVPFILRKGTSGKQQVEIFDNKEQARQALKVYQAERNALELKREKVISESTLDAAKLASDAAAREAAAQAAAERIRLDQLEERKKAEREEQFKQQAKAEQERRRKEAQRLGNEALALYKENRFTEAEAKFAQAVELDPSNKSYYFQYAITLYRTQKYNQSLVFLDLAAGADVRAAEKDYYRGLNFYGQKDQARALDAFKKVEDAKDPDLSPSGSFYRGLIYMEAKKYEESKNAFQLVLDTSKDPNLDKSAETYIEAILGIMQFEAERAKRWLFNITTGVTYDSNILSTSDSQLDSGEATDSAGWRGLVQASTKFRPLFNEKREFSVNLDLVDMYTVDDGFKRQQELTNTDPLMATLSAPYTFKGLLWGKGYKLDLTPGYETIYMSAEDNENKEIMHSYVFTAANTFINSDKWFTMYNFELRQEDSLLKSSTDVNDSDALKAKLSFGNFFILDEKKTEMITADIAYTSNQAKGDNVVFDRADLAVGYIGKAPWEMTWVGKLSYFLLNYSKNTNGRSDNSYTASLALSKKINDTFTSGFSSTYNLNQSNVVTSEYSKYTMMLTLTAGLSL